MFFQVNDPLAKEDLHELLCNNESKYTLLKDPKYVFTWYTGAITVDLLNNSSNA